MVDTPTSLYLLKYERNVGSKKKFYKIGITTRKSLSSRLRELQSAVNKSSNYNAYTVSEVDHLSLESWRDARRLERLFHSYEGLRFRPNEKFDGYDEMFKEGILGKWAHFMESDSFDPKGLSAEGISTFCVEDGRRWPEIEGILLKNKLRRPAIDYARRVLCSEWPALEEVLIKDGFRLWFRHYHWYSEDYLRYVFDVRKRRWPELEEKILAWVGGDSEGKKPRKNTSWIIDYCTRFIDARWPEIEGWLIEGSDLEKAVKYWKSVGEGRWEELEESLFRTRSWVEALDYWEDFGEGPWPELEERLLLSRSIGIHRLMRYAKTHKGDGWPDLESHKAMEDPGVALRYSIEVLDAPLEGREDEMFNHDPALYSIALSKNRTPEADAILLSVAEGEDLDVNPKYLTFFEDGWTELEASLATGLRESKYGESLFSKQASLLFSYVSHIKRESDIESACRELIVADTNDKLANNLLCRCLWIRGMRDRDLEPGFLEHCNVSDLIRYSNSSVKGRWQELEDMLTATRIRGVVWNRNVRADACTHYAIRVIRERWPEGEEMINTSNVNNSTKSLYAYALIGGNWPEADVYFRTDVGTGELEPGGWVTQMMSIYLN